MAATRRREAASLISELVARPRAFDFFQAVRLLELGSLEPGRRDEVGYDVNPEHEAVRFRSHPSLAFPAREIRGLRLGPEGGEGANGHAPAEMVVSFMGFTGAAGVLPQHYTELLIERLVMKDSALRDFLDLFHHRALSLFYRAWRKYRFPFAYEHDVRVHGREDTFTAALYSLVGLGQEAVRRRQAIDDSAFIFQGGHLARSQRSAVGLEDLLCDLFGMPVRVEQFVGQWIEIPEPDRTCLPRRGESPPEHARLGMGMTIGERVWDIQSKIRVHAGPLSYEQFEFFTTGSVGPYKLAALLRLYLGDELEFDLQLHLARHESPGIRLGHSQRPLLGRNTWLEHATSVPHERDALFQLDRI